MERFTERVEMFLCPTCKTTPFMLTCALLAVCNLFHFDTIMEPAPESIDQEGKEIPVSDGANYILIRLHIHLKMISSSHTFCIHITSHTPSFPRQSIVHTQLVFLKCLFAYVHRLGGNIHTFCVSYSIHVNT